MKNKKYITKLSEMFNYPLTQALMAKYLGVRRVDPHFMQYISADDRALAEIIYKKYKQDMLNKFEKWEEEWKANK
jgi:hypothetical protein